MKTKYFFYTAIILFPFFSAHKAKAQNRERNRSVTINQTVVDGKVISSDTIITYTDTTTRTINSKEVSIEMPYSKGGTVYVDNAYRKVNIRQAKDNKVRLVTTTFYYGEPTFTNEQWLEKLNIQMKNTDTGIVITSGGINRSTTGSSWGQNSYQLYSSTAPTAPEPPVASTPRITTSTPGMTVTTKGAFKEVKTPGMTVTTNGAFSEVKTPGKTLITNGGSTADGTVTTKSGGLSDAPVNDWWGRAVGSARGFSSVGNSTAVFDEKGNNVYNSSSLRRELTLYIPADAKLNVVSKYADVNADHDLKNLKIKISNGSLDMANVDNATIISTYSNISAGNITNGDISASLGKLSLKNADQLTLNTRYNKVEIDNCNRLDMKSTSDDYDLDAVKTLSGTQNYGSLRIARLTGSFDLKGSSADVKIRNIDPAVSFITLDNKYSDIRLPVSSLKNYEVIFSGNYSSVFAPFERKDTTLAKATSATDNPSGQVTTVFTGNGTSSYSSTLAPLASINGSNSRRNGQAFTATVGDTKGTHTIFKLVCNSCNVDFK